MGENAKVHYSIVGTPPALLGLLIKFRPLPGRVAWGSFAGRRQRTWTLLVRCQLRSRLPQTLVIVTVLPTIALLLLQFELLASSSVLRVFFRTSHRTGYRRGRDGFERHIRRE